MEKDFHFSGCSCGEISRRHGIICVHKEEKHHFTVSSQEEGNSCLLTLLERGEITKEEYEEALKKIKTYFDSDVSESEKRAFVGAKPK